MIHHLRDLKGDLKIELNFPFCNCNRQFNASSIFVSANPFVAGARERFACVSHFDFLKEM